MIYEIWCNGKLHYTRPEGHPDIQEALDLIERSKKLFGVAAYEVRPTPDAADLAVRPKGCNCASYVFDGTHNENCNLAKPLI